MGDTACYKPNGSCFDINDHSTYPSGISNYNSTTFSGLTSEFQRAYVIYNVENNLYDIYNSGITGQQITGSTGSVPNSSDLDNAKNTLNNFLSGVNTDIIGNLEQSIQQLSGKLDYLNTEVESGNKTVDEMTATLASLNASQNGASVLISDMNETYKTQYISNISIFIGCLLLIYLGYLSFL